MKKNLKLGVFGFGCVGQGLYHVLNDPAEKRFITVMPSVVFWFNRFNAEMSSVNRGKRLRISLSVFVVRTESAVAMFRIGTLFFTVQEPGIDGQAASRFQFAIAVGDEIRRVLHLRRIDDASRVATKTPQARIYASIARLYCSSRSQRPSKPRGNNVSP